LVGSLQFAVITFVPRPFTTFSQKPNLDERTWTVQMRFIGCFCVTCRSRTGKQCPYIVEFGEWTDVDITFQKGHAPMNLRHLDGVPCFFCNRTGHDNVSETSDGQRAGNVMLLCDHCEKGYHLKCMRHGKFSSIPKTVPWLCDFCSEERGGCAKCFETDVHDDSSKRLLHCDSCEASWHMHCLPTPLTTEPEDEWHCVECQSEIETACTSSCVVTRSQMAARVCGDCGVFIPHDEADEASRECSNCQSLWHSSCLENNTEAEAETNTRGWTCPACC
jgi:hypothetical protein